MKTHTAKSRQICISLLMMVLCSLQGCMYYYKVQTVSPVAQQEVKTFTSGDKYIILHQRDSAWHLSQPLVSENILYAKLTKLPDNRYKFMTTKPEGGNRYIKRKSMDESYLLDEVHLYVPDSVVPAQTDSGSVQVAFSKILNAEVYVKAKGRTNASWLVPGIGGSVLGVGVAVGVIGVAVSSSMSGMMGNITH
jgi:hypothetical protein